MLWGVCFFNYADRQMISSVFPKLKEEFGFTPVQLEYARRLASLPALSDPQMVNDTLGVLLKYQDDIVRMEGSEAKRILDQIKAELRAAERV